jgi:CCR4-NOT transcriptional regulation complex NOT5 subunit
MERFKALEKEMKMKAFSKEGLIAAAKLDPAEKAKRDCVDWIGTTTDELSRQIEQTEAEAETLQATGKKKKAAGDRLGELDELNERRTWHIGRLEVVQRMLENGQLSVEQVETIMEDVKYFVEANTVRHVLEGGRVLTVSRRKTSTTMLGSTMNLIFRTRTSTTFYRSTTTQTSPSRIWIPLRQRMEVSFITKKSI